MNNSKTPLELIQELPDTSFTSPNYRRQAIGVLGALSITGEYQHDSFIDGIIPVPLGLKKLYDEVKHKQPHMTFVIYRNPRWRVPCGEDEVQIYNHIGIAYTDAPEIMVGKLIYDRNKNGEPMFTVCADDIKNDRYATYNDDYHSKHTKKFANAVKTANQYLKPKTVQALKVNFESDLEHAQSQITAPAQHKLYESCSINWQQVKEEIESMISFDYTPKTTEFLKAFNLIKQEGDELKRLSKYKPKATFVWLKKDSAHILDSDGTETIATSPDAIPEDIRNKIAVLQIGADRSAVINVGVKIDNTKYWVFQ
jgi:hypothetical protein